MNGSRRFFGTDGIRGRVGSAPISADFVLRLGNALGQVLQNACTHPTVLIGKDTRISGYMFEAALEAGLVAAGVHVQLMGPMPTPAVAFLTATLQAHAGIVISASHNPHHDNGIKFFSHQGEKLDDSTELQIESALDGPFFTVDSARLGKAVRTRDAIGRYIEYCKATVARGFSLRNLRLVVDCAHGATYQLVPLLFAELGAQVQVIGASPDGLNINHGVGTMHMEHLARNVRHCGADLGIAFDGDGDRVLMVDTDGNVVDGDDLLYILARSWQRAGRLKGPVVGTLMTNCGLEAALHQQGIPFIRAKVGDRYVHQLLVDQGGILGGETSGHLLCLDRATSGDGIISALQVLEALHRDVLSLRQALTGFRKIPQSTVNQRVNFPADSILGEDAVQNALKKAQHALKGRGRAFIRASGTEPVLRITVEAETEDRMQQILDTLVAEVQSCMKA